MKRLAFLAMLLPGLPAMAQGNDPMALQRCIWQCLANSPGNTSPQYHQCVNTYCVEPQATAPLPQSGAWYAGVAADGYSRSAGVAAPDGSGQGIYFQCAPGRDSYLMLYALQTRAGFYQIVIDGRSYPMMFDRRRGQLTSDMPASAPFLNILSNGLSLNVIDPDGVLRGTFSLSGARAALWQARSACGG